MNATTAKNTIAEATAQFLLAAEELGAIATHLREASQDLEIVSTELCELSLNDALEAATHLESISSNLAATIAKSLTD
jgi:hypothetical protein